MRKDKIFLTLARASLKQAIMQAIPTIHNQAGQNTMVWFTNMFPQGEIQELDLKVRTRQTFFTKRIVIEFEIARVKGYCIKEEILNANKKAIEEKREAAKNQTPS